MIVQSVALARRSLLSLGLFGALVTWVPDQLHVAHAGDPPIVHDNRNPDARLQVLVKSVKVLNDRDPGSGEFWFKLFFWRVNPGCPPDSTDEACTTPLVTSASMEFSASDGETGTVNRAIPDANDGAWVYDATFGPEQGIPVFTDQTYGMALVGLEQDPAFGDDDVGKLFWVLSADNNWDIGDRTERGRQDVVSHCFPPIPFVGGCAYNPPGGVPADTIVSYEIRRMPLPDLVPINVRHVDVGNLEYICVDVTNSGARSADPFSVAIRADGGLVREAALPGLDVGRTVESCVFRGELPEAQHLLSFRIDEARDVAEMDEHNNIYEHRIEALPSSARVPQTIVGPAVASPLVDSPAATPSTDLSVMSIRVGSEKPGTAARCNSGKNDVRVVVKNQGSSDTTDITLHLQVDDNDVGQKTAANLTSGKEVELRFEDVLLKKGDHTLKATVDAKSTITELKEDNNELQLSVSCKDDD